MNWAFYVSDQQAHSPKTKPLSTQPGPPQNTHSKQKVWGWFANGQLYKSLVSKN